MVVHTCNSNQKLLQQMIMKECAKTMHCSRFIQTNATIQQAVSNISMACFKSNGKMVRDDAQKKYVMILELILQCFIIKRDDINNMNMTKVKWLHCKTAELKGVEPL